MNGHLHETIVTLIEVERHPGDAYAEVGKDAISHAIAVLMAVENLVKQKCRHNTEIAYRALELAAGAVE